MIFFNQFTCWRVIICIRTYNKFNLILKAGCYLKNDYLLKILLLYVVENFKIIFKAKMWWCENNELRRKQLCKYISIILLKNKYKKKNQF